MAKLKTIRIGYSRRFETYRVETVTDSLEFTPGSGIKKADLQKLCDDPAWKVTIGEISK